MNITGTLIEILDTIQVSEKFKKREFVIQDDENPQYPQLIKFELAQDKCSLMDGYSIGNKVDVSFNLRGREYINPLGVRNYFNQIQAWKISLIDKGQTEPIKENYKETTATNLPPVTPDDGLPF